MRAFLLGAALALAVTAPALAKPPVAPDPDLMTVSGRYGVPRAAADAPQLRLGSVTVSPAVAARTAYTVSAASPALRAAVERSLDNHGFATATMPLVNIDAEWSAVEVAADEAGATVTARLRVTAAAGAQGCLPYEASGTYRSLARRKSGAGRRIAGVLGTVATMGLDGGTVMARQMEWASAENRAMNAARITTDAEGVAPAFGDTAVVQYGAANAMRLALVDLLTRLNTRECAAQPSVVSSTGTP